VGDSPGPGGGRRPLDRRGRPDARRHRWIRSYVTTETDGSVGTVCIYQASSPEAIREHARRADMPADEIVALADTVVVRPDPESSST
jgi:uncharacterized protein DUF4242